MVGPIQPRKKICRFLLPPRQVAIIGAPYCSIPGRTSAASALFQSGLKGVVKDLGWRVDDNGEGGDVTTKHESKEARAIDPIDFYTEDEIVKSLLIGAKCSALFTTMREAALQRKFAMAIMDHRGMACGTIAAMRSVYPDLRVIRVSTHADCNIPSDKHTKEYCRMTLSHLTGWFEKRVVGFEWLDTADDGAPLRMEQQHFGLIGLQELNPSEQERLRCGHIHAFTMRDIDHSTISQVVTDVLKHLDPHGKYPLHLSFDMSGCDASVAPAAPQRTSKGGLTYREAHYIVEALAETNRLVSMDLSGIDPEMDIPNSPLHGDLKDLAVESGVTIRFAVDIILSALGKVIL